MFASTIHWKQYDPFRRQKDDAFRSSKNGVLELAERSREFPGTLTMGMQTGDAEQQKLLFVRHQSPIRANLISGGDGTHMSLGKCFGPFLLSAGRGKCVARETFTG